MNDHETDEFEYIDLDTIDQPDPEDEDYYEDDPLSQVRLHRSVGDDVFIAGVKL